MITNFKLFETKILKFWNDYNLITSDIFKHIDSEKFTIEALGQIEDEQMILIHPKEPKKGLKNILILAGFHGNEIAPVHSIKEYLAKFDYSILDKVNVSFIPVVNISGFIRNKRYNKWNQLSNYGFLLKKPKLSVEGKILIEHDELLKELSKDGFLTMHENVDRKNGYIYLYSKKDKEEVATAMTEELQKNLNNSGAK